LQEKLMFRWTEPAAQWIGRVVTQPREELDRWQQTARFWYDLGRFGMLQLRHDRATQMAGALAFRTLFGLFPVIVVATVLVRALGMQQYYLQPLGRLFEFWGLDEIQIVPAGAGQIPSVTLDVWLQQLVGQAERINVTAIGWVGVAVTLYAAISLLVTIENTFNVVYRASQGRSWASRVPVYWFVLTISPLLIITTSYIDNRFRQLMNGLSAQSWLTSVLLVLWSVCAFWLILLALYMLFPNTRVRFRPAMIGAAIGAVLLEIGKRTMGMYLENALSVSQLYGSLGLVPLFMFWVYLMWLGILFGLQVSSALQHLRGRQLAEWEASRSESRLFDPASILVLMERIARRFRRGQPATTNELAAETALPEQVLEPLIEELVRERFLHRVVGQQDAVSLSRPPETIAVSSLLDIARRKSACSVQDAALAEYLRTLRYAERQVAASTHLGALLVSTGV
jgi:membrane protein